MINVPKVTVMMSAYNAETTVERTIKSVLAQTYTNFEFIAINHGSTDHTKAIISKYAALDLRVRLMDIPKNLGCPAQALNLAMQEAKGEYWAFIDADDEYMPDFLTVMVIAAEENALDVVACSVRYRYVTADLKNLAGRDYSDSFFPTERFLVSKDGYERELLLFLDSFQGNFALYDFYWNKLYRAEFLLQNRLSLPNEYLYFADALFNDNVFSNKPHSAFLAYIGYIHDINTTSTGFTFHEKQMEEIYAYVASRMQWLDYSEGIDTKLFESNILSYIRNTLQIKNAPELNLEILKELENLMSKKELRLLMRHQDRNAWIVNSVWLNELMAYFYLKTSDNIPIQDSGFLQSVYRARNGFPSVSSALDAIFDENNVFSIGYLQLLDFLDRNESNIKE